MAHAQADDPRDTAHRERSRIGFEFGQPLPANLLYWRCDLAELPLQLCSELEEATRLIGQDRAVEAIQLLACAAISIDCDKLNEVMRRFTCHILVAS